MPNINLISTTTRVESPFIVVTIGEYTFGTYSNKSKRVNDSKTGEVYTKYSTTFPNFMQSINIVKVNGAVNTYNIVMVYAIRAGDDPNLLEKVFSSVSDSRKIYISYGDYSSPNFIYKEESAIMTSVKSNVNIANSTITYTITCTSDALNLSAGHMTFSRRRAKPSDILFEMLYNSNLGLLDIFYGMRNAELVRSKGLIASNDKEVQLEQKTNISPLEYMNYLVSCMSNVANSPNSVIKKSNYALTVVDDITGEFGGPYFKVVELNKDIKVNNSLDMYEIDIGYPTANIVLDFTINDDETYSILYNHSKNIEQADYSYRIDNKGEISYIYSPQISNSQDLLKTTEADKTWWTRVTQYPIKASLSIKGLLRPAILMSYLKLNVYFYGRKHIASGIYIITKQEDIVNNMGYRTNLTLTRVGADSDL